jgi:hypothetical protein
MSVMKKVVALVLSVHVSPENVETRLFVNAAGHYAVRVFDLDAQETYAITVFPLHEESEAKARKLFEDTVRLSS